jgi:hypothetical protein
MIDSRNSNFIGKDNKINYEAIIEYTESEISVIDEMIKDILLTRKELNSYCKSIKQEYKFFKKHSRGNTYKYNFHGRLPSVILESLIGLLNSLIARLEMNIQKMKDK